MKKSLCAILKFWWKTRILKEVVYSDKGLPLDCKGLRFKGDHPFGKDTVYYISSGFSKYTYCGFGSYWNGVHTHQDSQNPYRALAKLQDRKNRKL